MIKFAGEEQLPFAICSNLAPFYQCTSDSTAPRQLWSEIPSLLLDLVGDAARDADCPTTFPGLTCPAPCMRLLVSQALPSSGCRTDDCLCLHCSNCGCCDANHCHGCSISGSSVFGTPTVQEPELPWNFLSSTACSESLHFVLQDILLNPFDLSTILLIYSQRN